MKPVLSLLVPSGRIARATAAMLAIAACGPAFAGTNNLQDMPVLASSNGVLDLLMIAKAKPAPLLQPLVPQAALVYEICPRPEDGGEDCPAQYDTPNLYGGTRLQLEQGDLLKIHLVNRLPPLTDSVQARYPGMDWLTLNPTNIHTHGLLVAPRYPTKNNPTYGDNVFVLTLNPVNGMPGQGAELHSDMRLGSTDYEIRIPEHHPSGLFWFHPHVHGISQNQVDSGLSGVITIGKVSDYVCKGAKCASFIDNLPVRSMILKDTQVLADGTIFSENDPQFCGDNVHSKNPPKGSCEGDVGFPGGRYYFTINGQTYPNINVHSAHGEIWRLTNASASAIYDLRLMDASNKAGMIVQVLSVDGVAVAPRKNESAEDLLDAGGAQFEPVPCAGGKDGNGSKDFQPLCVRRMLMFPASRVEVWVGYRDANGNLAKPPAGGATAVLRTVGHVTGDPGGDWPAMDLATVTFHGDGPPVGMPQTLAVAGAQARALESPTGLAGDLRQYNVSVGSDEKCAPLPKGHKRRIYLNSVGEMGVFGMGYEEIDENGDVVPGTTQNISAFNPDKPTICVPLGPGNAPVKERWQILNIADEDHSFHMHQVRFEVVAKDSLYHDIVPGRNDIGVLHDSIPLKHATDGECAGIGAYHAGLCKTDIEEIEVPFAVAGDFVYHCHVLAHEDAGMMARIRVRPNPGR